METGTTETIIKTLFEFTSNGYEATSGELKSLLEANKALTVNEKSLTRQRNETIDQLDKLTAKYIQYENTLNSSSTNKERENFVQTKNTIKELQQEVVSLGSKIDGLNKVQVQNTKQTKNMESAAVAYKKVLDELKKGMDNAEVSTEALTNAKKFLKNEMSKKDINTEQYTVLSKELALVEKTIKTLNEAMRQNVKDLDVSARGMAKAKQAADSYAKVMTELSKDAGEANVSLNELIQTQRYIREQMSSTPIGAEGYNKLKDDILAVNTALSEARKDFSATTQESDIHENSIAALRIRYNALKDEILKMDQADAGFENKQKQAKALNDELITAESQLGVFSRNVGNYKSTFDGLGWSMAQVMREAPAFAHSVTTGFMAISNNLPMLYDEVKKLKVANAALNAEGVKTPSIMKSIAKAALSWNAAISLGITLLTIYGKDIVNWIGSLFKAKKGLDAVASAQERLNEAKRQGSLNAVEEQTQLKILYEVATDTTKSMTDRLAAIAQLQEKFPAYFSNLTNEAILAGEAADEYKRLGISIERYEQKKTAQTKLTDTNEKLKRLEDTAGYKEMLAAQDKLNALTEKGITPDYGEKGLNDGWFKAYPENFEENRDQLNEATRQYNEAQRSFLKGVKKSNKEFHKELKDEMNAENTDVLGLVAILTNTKELATKELKDSVAVTDPTTDPDKGKKKEKGDGSNDTPAERQKKINEEYKAACEDYLDIKAEVARAEAEDDKESLAILQRLLVAKEKAKQDAAKKGIKLSQDEKDEIALAEYENQEKIEDINKKAQEEKVKDYIKANDEVRKAQDQLLEAQKGGNADEIALYQRNLESKQKELAKFNAEDLKLSEEQQLEEELADNEQKKTYIEDYKSLKTEQLKLDQDYKGAKNNTEREYIKEEQAILEAQLKIQVEALEKLGIKADEIRAAIKPKVKDDQKLLSEQLDKSLQTIGSFVGESKNKFFKLSSGIASLLAKAFDIKTVTDDAGENIDDAEEKLAKLKESFLEISAATMLSGLEVVTDNINEQLDREKEAIDSLYSFQERRAEESYDEQSKALERSFDKQSISSARYKLEQRKLDDKKAKEDKQRERDKANALYDIQVKQFRVQQAQDAISAVIATALAVMKTFGKSGFPTGIPLAAAMTALGAAQVAAIYAQQPPDKPKFKKGGFLDFEKIDGPSHDNGGVPVTIGNRTVAEAEGGEGALIISKRAMKNDHMRNLLAFVESEGARLSGDQSEPGIFEQGGYIDYDEIFKQAKEGLRITKIKKKSARINGEKVKLKDYQGSLDNAMNAYAEPIAKAEYNRRIEVAENDYEQKLNEQESNINTSIGKNAYLKEQGITDINQYNKRLAQEQEELDRTKEQISIYEDEAESRIEALKTAMQYDQKIEEFDKRRTDAAEELTENTLQFNERILKDLKETGQITEEEYLSMLDQVKNGYGVKTADIINLKKKEVEEIKKLINEERNAELDAVKEASTYREEALAQMRSEWQENYEAVTQQIIEDIENASEAASELTGTDLERFNQILHIQQSIQQMDEEYKKNDILLNDGVIQSREEQAALVSEQKRIKEELALREEELETAKADFEAERQKNMESALKSFETENFADLLAQIKELGSELQTEGNKWSLDKEIASELDESLKQINDTYDAQIAKQDAVVEGLQAELDAAQLLHDQKVANIKKEEDAFKQSFETQKAQINAWLEDATKGLRSQAASLAQFISTLKVEGLAAGVSEYEKAIAELDKDIEGLGTKKYASGGAIELGSGLFQVSGASHASGGVPVKVGNTTIAEVEGIEKMFAVNKMAASDPEMVAALDKASRVNSRYTGVPLIESSRSDGFNIDYDLLAAKIGAEINMRPTKTYLTHRDIKSAYDITEMHKKSSFMK